MSFKEKALTAKNKVTTYISNHKQDIVEVVIISGVIMVLQSVYTLTQNVKKHGVLINQHADAGNFINENPWYLEKNEDDTFTAKRVNLNDKSVTIVNKD